MKTAVYRAQGVELSWEANHLGYNPAYFHYMLNQLDLQKQYWDDFVVQDFDTYYH
jgi:hypothetical protein|tara:strand:- start:502 stop:666 length:165 start_codon:yes stop_codon:yes gene_type:complete